VVLLNMFPPSAEAGNAHGVAGGLWHPDRFDGAEMMAIAVKLGLEKSSKLSQRRAKVKFTGLTQNSQVDPAV
jgi:hypothetical protein